MNKNLLSLTSQTSSSLSSSKTKTTQVLHWMICLICKRRERGRGGKIYEQAIEKQSLSHENEASKGALERPDRWGCLERERERERTYVVMQWLNYSTRELQHFFHPCLFSLALDPLQHAYSSHLNLQPQTKPVTQAQNYHTHIFSKPVVVVFLLRGWLVADSLVRGRVTYKLNCYPYI